MDWQKMINDVLATGMTQKEVGDSLGHSQVWVADVSAGKYADLKWGTGQQLIRLHKRVCLAQKKAA